MSKNRFYPEIVLDKSSLIPLRAQLESKLLRAIQTERPQPGTRMVSERTLARELGINRDTVHYAYEALAKENLLNVSPLRGGGMMISAEVRNFSFRPFPCICLLLPFSFRQSIEYYSAGGVELVSGIMDRAAECGISTNVLSMPSLDADEPTVSKWIDSFIHRSNGIITLGVRTKTFDPVFGKLLESKVIPHVFLTGKSQLPHIGSVTIDYSGGMREMLKTLQDYGHKNLLLITGEEESEQFFNCAYQRAGDIEKTAGQYGIVTRRHIIKQEYISGNTEILTIADAVSAGAKDIDAIWINDCGIARKLCNELQLRGFEIPRDFSIISNDTGKNEKFISSIDYDHFEAGAMAVDLIKDMFDNGQSVSTSEKTVPNKFILRNSIKNCKKENRV